MALRTLGLKTGWGNLKRNLQQVHAAATLWLKHERLVTIITVTCVVLANAILLLLLLADYFADFGIRFFPGVREPQNLVYLFVLATLFVPLAFLVPEFGLWLFTALAAGGVVQSIRFITYGTSGRGALMLGLFGLLTFRAALEYFRLPRSERPRLFSILTISMIIFVLYYIIHLGYVVLFQQSIEGTDIAKTATEYLRVPTLNVVLATQGTMYFWLMVPTAIVLLRDLQRLRRFTYGILLLLFYVTSVSVVGYFAPLSLETKVALGLFATFESEEGVRLRGFEGNQLILFGSFLLLAYVGLDQRLNRAWVWGFYLLTLLGIFTNKTRVIWFSYLLLAPLILLVKPRDAFWRQIPAMLTVGLIIATALLHPVVQESAVQISDEFYRRMMRSFEPHDYWGKGPVAWRQQEIAASMGKWWNEGSTFNHWFGFGVVETYNFYTQEPSPRGGIITYNKVHIHNNWVHFIFKMGLVGLGLFLMLLVANFVRAWQIFRQVPNRYARAFLIAFQSYMISSIIQANLHHQFIMFPVVPMFVFGWAIMELIPYWHRWGLVGQDS